MSPLQISVYWRLFLIYFLTPFLFFLDIFTAAIAAKTCRHDNATNSPAVGSGLLPLQSNQSERGEFSGGEADWWTQNEETFWCNQWFSCRFGKRPLLLVSACVHTFCGIVPAFLPQPIIFLAVRCLTAVSCSCITICAFSLAVEWTLPAARLWPPAFLSFCFSLGTMGGALVAWLSPTWTHLHLMVALPQLLCLPLYLSIPESPRWLLLQKKMDILERYWSNSPADEQHLNQLLDSAQSDLKKAAETRTETPDSGGHAHSNIIHLRHPTILLRLLIMSFLSIGISSTYYGICLNIGSFGVGVYTAQFFSGLSEVPCLLVPLVRLGRRLISMLSLFLSGTACGLAFLLSLYNCEPILVMSLALLGKLCIQAAYFISVLYSIELFPTVVRQRCVSLVSLAYRVGSLATTFLPSSPDGALSLAAMVVYTSGPIVGCGLCMLLPETSSAPLPDSFEDCDRKSESHPASIDDLWRSRSSASSQTSKTETLLPEKDDALKANTPFL
ncbi:solute carrier family 22 member 13 [Nematolebias whitei]|uniref:solute carrier family 22 member 13 n=1 Tax=Nematolebias whitei TaxID=451745 RepID=UPI00189B0AD8|nr:solute carrier family 22 member 13 [Nematolebias whitei]